MRKCLAVACTLLLLGSVAADAAPSIDLELATERGLQITAPHEWLQLLAAIGINNVRIRSAQPSDRPQVKSLGTAERPRYHVTGILTSRDNLSLPGAIFSRADRARLKDYFERLSADGSEALTAPRGMFGLTEKEIQAVFADLAQPIEFETKGLLPLAVLNRLQTNFVVKISLDPQAEAALRESTPVIDELAGLSAGTGFALMLRDYGLVLRPEKSRGQPIVLRVAPAPADWVRANTLGKTADHEIKHWPVGWELQKTPGATAPSLFEYLNAEIDGYTLEETLAAIRPRLKIPMYLDHAALAAHEIDPAQIQVRVPRTRTAYKLVIDRVLSQARLGSQLRLDEAGRPFLWIMR